MAENNNNHTNAMLSSALGVAKKLSSSGVEALQRVRQNGKNPSIEKSEHSATDPESLLREQLPQFSKQLLGRHYGLVNKVSHFVAPELTDKMSDYLFNQLNTLSSNLSSVDAVLDEAGARDLEELTQDIDRSQRISHILAEQNKWIASAQGAVSGATGVIGSAIDVPASLILSLRSIYQIGRAYGFELNKDHEQDVVQFIFRQIDLGLIAEKQTLLMALKAISSSLQQRDLKQIQQLLGTNQDTQVLTQWLQEAQGEGKLEWLKKIPQFHVLAKLTPLASASLSAAYSWKLLEDVNHKAQQIFSEARSYLQQHGEVQLSPIAAYQKSRELLIEATPKLLEQLKLNEVVKLPEHNTISQVVIQKKSDPLPEPELPVADQVQQGIEQLAADLVAPNDGQQQQPALTRTEAEFEAVSHELLEDQQDKAKDVETKITADEAEPSQTKPKKALKSSKRRATDEDLNDVK